MIHVSLRLRFAAEIFDLVKLNAVVMNIVSWLKLSN